MGLIVRHSRIALIVKVSTLSSPNARQIPMKYYDLMGVNIEGFVQILCNKCEMRQRACSGRREPDSSVSKAHVRRKMHFLHIGEVDVTPAHLYACWSIIMFDDHSILWLFGMSLDEHKLQMKLTSLSANEPNFATNQKCCSQMPTALRICYSITTSSAPKIQPKQRTHGMKRYTSFTINWNFATALCGAVHSIRSHATTNFASTNCAFRSRTADSPTVLKRRSSVMRAFLMESRICIWNFAYANVSYLKAKKNNAHQCYYLSARLSKAITNQILAISSERA